MCISPALLLALLRGAASCLSHLITLLIRTPVQMLFFSFAFGRWNLALLSRRCVCVRANVCVCVRASLFCLANALGFEELKPVMVFFLLCQFDQY